MGKRGATTHLTKDTPRSPKNSSPTPKMADISAALTGVTVSSRKVLKPVTKKKSSMKNPGTVTPNKSLTWGTNEEKVFVKVPSYSPPKEIPPIVVASVAVPSVTLPSKIPSTGVMSWHPQTKKEEEETRKQDKGKGKVESPKRSPPKEEGGASKSSSLSSISFVSSTVSGGSGRSKTKSFSPLLVRHLNTDHRMEVYELIQKGNIPPSKSGSCMRQRVFLDKVILKQHIGSPSINGEAFRACYPIVCPQIGKADCHCSEHSVTIAIKKIPVYPGVPLISSKDDITKGGWTKYDIYAEIVALQLCTFLVKAKVCPNLPMFFSYYPCKDCTFSNEELNRKLRDRLGVNSMRSTSAQISKTSSLGSRCVIMLNEFATGGDVEHWFSEKEAGPGGRDLALWMNMYFQIFMGVAAIQKYFGMIHNDLHWGNVLVHKLTPGGVWKYTLNDIDYYCPNLGFLFVLWDFGYVNIPGKIEISVPDKRFGKYTGFGPKAARKEATGDTFNIAGIIRWLTVDAKEEGKDPHIPPTLQKNFLDLMQLELRLGELIPILFQDLYSRERMEGYGPITHSYDLDTPPGEIPMPPEYRKYLTNQNMTLSGPKKEGGTAFLRKLGTAKLFSESISLPLLSHR